MISECLNANFPALRTGLAAGLMTFAIVGATVAGQYEDWSRGIAAYSRRNYAAAMRIFRPLADQGNASAQFYIGFMYNQGQGVPQSAAQSVTL
jgi:hypothetical protein